MSNPIVTLKDASILKASMPEKGKLCNAYSPLLNLVDSNTQEMGNFTTDQLNFDLQHPVDILPQDSYDGAVNLVINDGKNIPRLVNSRFSVLNDTEFAIPDHTGYKDTNIYDESTFNIDTALKAIPLKIPTLQFNGEINNSGNLKCGSYTFYFKLSDADGNETEVIQESGIVQMFIGEDRNPGSLRMGLEREDTSKSVEFTLSNIDSGFDYVHVLYARCSSGQSEALASEYYKINFDYPVVNLECKITITGQEPTEQISDGELYTDYADIASAATQTQQRNVLLFGNTKEAEHDYDALRRMSWKIIPSWAQEENVGYLDSSYEFKEDEYSTDWTPKSLTEKSPTRSTTSIRKLDLVAAAERSADAGYIYYNSKNTYYKVGYWPDEIYRFGIVYIFEDMSLSPVFNIQGIDFNELSSEAGDNYAGYFFDSDPEAEGKLIEFSAEPEDCWFNKALRTNSRGVIKMPRISTISGNNRFKPGPICLKFNFDYIGQGILEAADKPDPQRDSFEFAEMFAFHKIRGFVMVRQKRIPTILALGIAVGLTKEDYGCIPTVYDSDRGSYLSQSFLSSDRTLLNTGTTINVPRENVVIRALYVPDAVVSEATYNNIFTGDKFALDRIGNCKFKLDSEDNTFKPYEFSLYSQQNDASYIKVPVMSVPEDTHLLSDGTNYFSTVVGNPEEPYKTADVAKAWRWTPPQDLTTSTTVIRGLWGPFVGLGDPENGKIEHGDVFNIKTLTYATIGEDKATDLDFLRRFHYAESYSAICDRMEPVKTLSCYRGDCFLSVFTHRIMRNFIDTELPTNKEIVDPMCWAANYAVRCTAEILGTTSNNMLPESEGWYVYAGAEFAEHMKKQKVMSAIILLLTGNVIGGLMNLFELDSEETTPNKLGLGDNYVYYNNDKWYSASYVPLKFPNISLDGRPEVGTPYLPAGFTPTNNTYYRVEFWSSPDVAVGDDGEFLPEKIEDFKPTPHLLLDKKEQPIAWDSSNFTIRDMYPNGMANEVVQAFETINGSMASTFNPFFPLTSLVKLLKYGKNGPEKKKVNPKEQEKQGGFNLKAIFHSDDGWDLHGISSINRADVNAVGLGQWITFPICSSKNLALRDVDFSNATEQASFSRKRAFYPLRAKSVFEPLRDSNACNLATAVSVPNKKYNALPNVPFIKLEYFTRVYTSLKDSAISFTNEYKVILENSYLDYTKAHGSITKLVSLNNIVYVIFKHGIGYITVDVSLENPKNYIPANITMLSDDFGSIWKDSVYATDNYVYGVDTVGKKIWRLRGTTIEFISDHVVGKYLIDNFDMSEFETSPYIGHINVKTHYNKFKHDVMFTYYNDTFYKLPEEYWDTKYSIDDEGYITEDAQRILSDEGRWVSAVKVPLENFEDYASNPAPAYTSNDVLSIVRAGLGRWAGKAPWSLCYNEDTTRFSTFYDWIPVESENIDNIYFSFDREAANQIIESPKASSLATLYLTDYISSRKFEIDEAFTERINIYYSTTTDNAQIVFDGSWSLPKDELSCLLFYYKSPVELELMLLPNKDSAELHQGLILAPTDEWASKFIFIRSTADDNPTLYWKIKATGEVSLENPAQVYISGVHQVVIDKTLYANELAKADALALPYTAWGTLKAWLDPTNYIFVNYKENKNNVSKYWELRNTINNIKLWKHGQAGVYDNQGAIKPTCWYGKQHEFNFEFVVNKDTTKQKIFNNLKIVSNKTEPYKFEYEVVGEGYQWYKYKPIITWINKQVDGVYDLDYWYKVVLTTDYPELLKQYPDFPAVFGVQEIGNRFRSLPYLKIKFVDRKGTRSLDTSNDTQPDAYKDNTSDIVYVYDQQLNEHRVRTEQLGNDVKKFGRTRGNMEYLEDLWDVEIRPVPVKYAFIPDPKLLINNTSFLPGRNVQFEAGDSGAITSISLGDLKRGEFELQYPFLADATYRIEGMQHDVDAEYAVYLELYPDAKPIKIGEGILKADAEDSAITFKMKDKSGRVRVEIRNLNFENSEGLQIITQDFALTELMETRHRDKYLKVKIRYSGQDLAVIQQIYTIFNKSFA